MTTLKEKVKLALDESRMLILGAQVFLGIEFRSAFEKGFELLPKTSQYIKLASLFILLIAIGFLMAPGSYHRIVRAGSDSPDVHAFATTMMDVALIPFLLAVSLDFYVMAGKILGVTGGVTQAAIIGGLGFFFWYGWGLLARRRSRSKQNRKNGPASPTELKDKIDQVLTEARVVLPGVQALLGFQFITMFMDSFDKLPSALKYLHMAGLGVMGFTMILLMTPAAYHRIAEGGEDSTRFHLVASGLLLAAMVLLPLGICSEVYIVFRKVSDSGIWSAIAAGVAMLFFYGLWFGFTAYRRTQLDQND